MYGHNGPVFVSRRNNPCLSSRGHTYCPGDSRQTAGWWNVIIRPDQQCCSRVESANLEPNLSKWQSRASLRFGKNSSVTWMKSPYCWRAWCFRNVKLIWLVVSNIFYFHLYLGKITILTIIFQMGWNHQLVNERQSTNRGDESVVPKIQRTGKKVKPTISIVAPWNCWL